jgi:hypothetical protein
LKLNFAEWQNRALSRRLTRIAADIEANKFRRRNGTKNKRDGRGRLGRRGGKILQRRAGDFLPLFNFEQTAFEK